MSIATKLDQLHGKVKCNRWLWYFTIFCRVALALGFLPSGFVKIMGERFTALSNNHPMGHYLEALHQTGYYYTFIGIIQVTAAVLLLIPRTALLGALLYFPVILNICILSLAVRFDGSLLSSPLMVIANLYLLCWDYDKLKFILPFKQPEIPTIVLAQERISYQFPARFFAGAGTTVLIIVMFVTNAFHVKPMNSLRDCNRQFKGTSRIKAGTTFCECIHKQGHPLDNCLEEYDKAADDFIKGN